MVYADTDFFVALFKPRDWLKPKAERYLASHRGILQVTPFVLTELLLLADELKFDPQRLIVDALNIAEQAVTPLDALHAAVCALQDESIISSDAVYDRLGIRRIQLGY